jgi:hypothetical protein
LRKSFRLQTITTSTQHFTCRSLLNDPCPSFYAFNSSQKKGNDRVSNSFSQSPSYFHHPDKRIEQPFISHLHPFQQQFFIQGKFEKTHHFHFYRLGFLTFCFSLNVDFLETIFKPSSNTSTLTSSSIYSPVSMPLTTPFSFQLPNRISFGTEKEEEMRRVLTNLQVSNPIQQQLTSEQASVIEQDPIVFHLDSVLQKRRRKMNKHKRKKRRKLQRALLRRLGRK